MNDSHDARGRRPLFTALMDAPTASDLRADEQLVTAALVDAEAEVAWARRCLLSVMTRRIATDQHNAELRGRTCRAQALLADRRTRLEALEAGLGKIRQRLSSEFRENRRRPFAAVRRRGRFIPLFPAVASLVRVCRRLCRRRRPGRVSETPDAPAGQVRGNIPG